MFSDKFRLLKVFVLVFLLIGLVYYAEIQGPKVIPGFREFENNPEKFINREVEFGGKIKKIESGAFFVEQKLDGKVSIIKIDGSLEKGKLGDNIQGVAVYGANKTLVLDRYIISNSHWFKVVISFFALPWVLFLFIRDYTFNFKKHA